MRNELEQPMRQNLRLKDYDYSENGAYFITIAVKNKHYLFGKVSNQQE